MNRRLFLAGLGAAGCSANSSGLQSVVPEDVPGDLPESWPDPVLDVQTLTPTFVAALDGTGIENIDALIAGADEELRAVAALSPASAALGKATIEALVLPAMETLVLLRDDLPEDEVGDLLAQAFDLTGLDAVLPAIEAAREELAFVGTPTSENREVVASTMRDLAQGLRAQLAIAGRSDNPLAQQVLHELELLAIQDSFFDGAVTAIENASERPPPPPFASLCTNLGFVAETWDERRSVLAAYFDVMLMLAGITPTVGTVAGQAVRLFGSKSVRAFSKLSIVLIGVGVAFLIMPFLLAYTPPTIETLHHRMCDCEGA